jgi:hypothetical protein
MQQTKAIHHLVTGIIILLTVSSCSKLVSWKPSHLTDTSDVTITCDATMGSRELYNYEGPVYVHIGLLTDMSSGNGDWQYSKFEWGTTDEAALAQPAGKNKWSYRIQNLRKFFGVDEDEQIYKLGILFRSACNGGDCKVLKNKDGSDILISVDDESQK